MAFTLLCKTILFVPGLDKAVGFSTQPPIVPDVAVTEPRLDTAKVPLLMLKAPALIDTAPALVTTKLPLLMLMDPPVIVAASNEMATLMVPAVILPASMLAITALPIVLEIQDDPLHSHCAMI